MFCPQCGAQGPQGARFCMSCGCNLGNVQQANEPQQSRAPQQGGNNQQQYPQQVYQSYGAPSYSVAPHVNQGHSQGGNWGSTPASEALFLSNGSMTAAGSQLFSTIFRRFDTDGDNQLNYPEWCALTGTVGGEVPEEAVLGVALQAQGVSITPQGGITQDSFFHLMSTAAKYDSDKMFRELNALGYNYPRSALPPQAPLAEKQLWEQEMQQKAMAIVHALQGQQQYSAAPAQINQQTMAQLRAEAAAEDRHHRTMMGVIGNINGWHCSCGTHNSTSGRCAGCGRSNY